MRLISLRVLVDDCLPFIKPVWSGCIISGVIFSILLARALQIILRSRLLEILGGSWMEVRGLFQVSVAG